MSSEAFLRLQAGEQAPWEVIHVPSGRVVAYAGRKADAAGYLADALASRAERALPEADTQ